MVKKIIKRSIHFAIITAVVVLVPAFMALSFTACKTAAVSDDEQPEATENAAATSAAETTQAKNTDTSQETQPAEIKLKDGLGNEVALEAPAEKIIVFVPSTLEILDALLFLDFKIKMPILLSFIFN